MSIGTTALLPSHLPPDSLYVAAEVGGQPLQRGEDQPGVGAAVP